jgi:hypothetical protein
MVQPTAAAAAACSESRYFKYTHLIVPSNTVDLNAPCRRIYVGGTGTLAVAVDGNNGFPISQTFATDDLTANTMLAAGHGMLDGQIVVVTSATTLPAGLSANTLYYVISTGLTANVFKLSASLGGSAVDITDAGTGVQTMHRISAQYTALPVGKDLDIRASRIFATGTSATLMIAHW